MGFISLNKDNLFQIEYAQPMVVNIIVLEHDLSLISPMFFISLSDSDFKMFDLEWST